jgi:3-oxoadipate enol-lactonase
MHHELSARSDAEVVVLAPSLGTTLSAWEPVARLLGRRYRVVRYDLRGHGRSPAPPGPYSIAELAGDLEALLDRLGLEWVSLCGVSIGAMACMCLAARAPQRVRTLVVCCSSALVDRGRYRQRAEAVRRGGIQSIADEVLARWLTPAYARVHPAVVDRLRDDLLHTSSEGYAGCCDALAAMDLRPALGAIAAPTLVISAADDEATPPEHGRELAARIPHARFVLLSAAAHLASVERPSEVADLILGHLEQRTEDSNDRSRAGTPNAP